MIAPCIVLDELALVFYILASICYGASLLLSSPMAPVQEGEERNQFLMWGRLAVVPGIALQLGSTGCWCVLTHLSPFASKYGTLSVLAWTLAILFLFFDLRLRLRALGAVALPIILLFQTWGLLNAGRPAVDNRVIESQVISIHVMAIVVGIALFVLAFACACLYLLQNRLLKARRVGRPLRFLPPLATLDRVAYLSVAYGLPFLSLGLALGIAYLLTHMRAGQSLLLWFLDPHNFAAFLLWFIYAFYLLARLVWGWRGVRLQYVLVSGLPLMLVLYLLPSPTHRFAP